MNSTCPDGFLFEKSLSCYSISADFLSWSDAKAACETLSSSLLTISNSDENTYIDTILPGLALDIPPKYWVALIGFSLILPIINSSNLDRLTIISY